MNNPLVVLAHLFNVVPLFIPSDTTTGHLASMVVGRHLRLYLNRVPIVLRSVRPPPPLRHVASAGLNENTRGIGNTVRVLMTPVGLFANSFRKG